MVAYADLVLPDTTYLERYDCISLLDRPISDADGAGRRDPPAGGRARPRRARLPGRAARPRRAARPAGLGRRRRHAAVPRLCRLHRQPRARARHRPARRLARRGRRRSTARARRIPTSSSATSTTAASGSDDLPRAARYYKHGQPRLSRLGAARWASSPTPSRSCCSSIPRRCRVPPRRAGPRRGAAAGPSTARASRPISIRCRSGTRRSSRRRRSTRDDFPLHAITQRPMAMYHSWGSQNAWLRQIADAQLAVRASATPARALGLADDDWVEVELAPRPRSRVQVEARSTACNPTRSGPGTRSASAAAPGSWRRTRRKSNKGFLLNHLIADVTAEGRSTPTPIRSPARRRGTTCACASARRDARRRERAAVPAAAPSPKPTNARCATAPRMRNRAAAEQGTPNDRRCRRRRRRSSAWSSTSTPASAAMPARPAARNGTPAAIAGAADRRRSLRRGADGRLAQPRAQLRGRATARGSRRRVHFPRSCLHCETPACVTVCPTGASYKRAEDGIVLVDEDKCIGCKLCALGLPLRRARVRRRSTA